MLKATECWREKSKAEINGEIDYVHKLGNLKGSILSKTDIRFNTIPKNFQRKRRKVNVLNVIQDLQENLYG